MCTEIRAEGGILGGAPNRIKFPGAIATGGREREKERTRLDIVRAISTRADAANFSRRTDRRINIGGNKGARAKEEWRTLIILMWHISMITELLSKSTIVIAIYL